MNDSGSRPALALGEFVPMCALMISLVALSIDAMLPALGVIGADLGVRDTNDTQLVVSVLLLGLGIGQLLYGPLSDSIGRKPAIYLGMIIFLAGTVLSMTAGSFTMMIIGRAMQGFGAAAPRIVIVALVRDQLVGDAMARIMSFVMAVFILVPVVAPLLGQVVVSFGHWRMIFGLFLVIAVVASTWFAIRQPETLEPSRRRPFAPGAVARGMLEVVKTRAALGYTVATGFVFAPFVAYLSASRQIFQEGYDTGVWFPAYFALLALGIGTASFVNGRLVMRYGMRRLCEGAMTALIGLSFALAVVAVAFDGLPPLWVFVVAFILVFFCLGMAFGNLNALAMEPLGHIAGVGAAVTSALSTAMSVPIGAMVGRAFDGTVLPLVAAFAVFGLLSLASMRWARGSDPV